MASLRNGGDRQAARRGTSPAPSGTAPRARPSSASSSRPSSTVNSPDKEHLAAAKPTPNYLRPTLSFQASDGGAHPKVKSGTAPAKRLTRIKSMEKPPAHHPHPHTARTAPAAGVKPSSTALKSSTAASSSSARAGASSMRAVTDKTRKPAAKSLAPGANKARTGAGPGAGKKKEVGASASSCHNAAPAHHHNETEEGLENKDHDEPKTITITTDPASPSAQVEHHGEVELHDVIEEREEQEHPEEEHHHPPEAEESHDAVPEPEEETQPVSADSPPLHVTEHEVSLKFEAKHDEDNSQPTPDGHPEENRSTSSPPAPAAETNKFLTRSRTVPARPKPSDAAKIPVDDELHRKLMSRKAWEMGGGADTTSHKVGGEEASGPGFKSQGTLGKKDSPAYNDVIEETASKLNEKRKNKVLALAGAFETVISLQEPKTPQSGQQSPATDPAGASGTGETHTPPPAVLPEVDDTAADSEVKGDEEPHNSETMEEVPTQSADVATGSNPDEGDAGGATAKE